MFDESFHEEVISELRSVATLSKNVEKNNVNKVSKVCFQILRCILQLLGSLEDKELSSDENRRIYIQLNRHAYSMLNAGIIKDDKISVLELGKEVDKLADTLEYAGANKITFALENKIITVIDSVLNNNL